MKRLLIGILALSALAGAASAADGSYYVIMKGDPEKPDLCLFRDAKSRDRSAPGDQAYVIGKVSRAGGSVSIDQTVYTPSGDWSVEDRYRFAADGSGTLERSGASASSGTGLKERYAWGPAGKAERTLHEIRDLEPPHAPTTDFYPDDMTVITRPDGFDFWLLVEQLDAVEAADHVCMPSGSWRP
ncbi:hypothetical protein [Caulobacter sp. NIBR1757]|uniref:hypothetical protein n=1 Tax=Caulobacter sp. NIBR1757 TaxID=3016000 RepID=UPI0022F0716A|nr:hypothetical protein [Caulobacter sp. NIBR1757]WGM38899.1 hypothetical protein AMEJIAPC_01809 [Caulobacter sp. NIBR1757]